MPVHRDEPHGPRRDRHPRRGAQGALLRLRDQPLQALRVDLVGHALWRGWRPLRSAGRNHEPERDAAVELDRDGDLGRAGRARLALRRNPRRLGHQRREELAHRRASLGLALRARCALRRDDPLRSRRANRTRCRVPRAPRKAEVMMESTAAWSLTVGEVDVESEQEVPKKRKLMLWVDDVTVDFDGFLALDHLTLAVDEGELRCIIGPNGAGKTTLMDVITGKTRATSAALYLA